MATAIRGDIESVGQKLQSFSGTLPEQERNVLGWLTSRAQSSSNRTVEGDVKEPAPARDLASALGFNEDTAVLTVEWQRGIFAE